SRSIVAKGGRQRETGRSESFLCQRKKSRLLKESQRGATNGQRGVYKSLQGHQQGRLTGEKARTVPVHHEELWQPRKDLTIPERSSQGDQVLMSCATNVSSMEGNNNSGELSPALAVT
ncbi:hypothetical protein TNCT_452741, partial [Trichonephila clavata]